MIGVNQIISDFTVNPSGSNSTIEKWTQTGQIHVPSIHCLQDTGTKYIT